jgi:pimeloyl-ACP methyl ester carboxylesterase
MWPRAWVRELERDHRVITPDNRGSGFSRDLDGPFSIADMADDVAAVLDDAEVADADVFGISMGGMIAQELALRHPERVRTLILAGSRPPNPDFEPPGLATRWLLIQPPARGTSLAQFFDRLWSFAAAPGFAEAHPGVIDEITRQSLERPTPRATLINQSRAMAAWGHAERLGGIVAPTLVVHGRLDRLSPVQNGRNLAAAIAHSRYVELPDVGHLVPHEAPDLTAELIREHSRSVQAR